MVNKEDFQYITRCLAFAEVYLCLSKKEKHVSSHVPEIHKVGFYRVVTRDPSWPAHFGVIHYPFSSTCHSQTVE